MAGGGATSKAAAPTSYPILSLADLGRAAAQRTPTAQTAGPPSLASTAASLASQNVAAQVAAIRAQQQADNADAAARARLINRASAAAANYLGPGGLDLAGVTKQDYADALAQTQGLASGYSDQFRQNAAAQAGAANTTLGSITGNTQKVTSQGGSIADLLYGLRGVVPGTALATEGLGATEAARTLGAAVRASGLNQALGVIGAGRADARALDPRIAAAQGQIPSLTERYLGDLVSQQAKLGPKLYSTGGGLYSYDPTTGLLTTLKAPAAAAGGRPSINDTASRSTGVLTYVGTDGQLHSFTDAKGKPIPYVGTSSGSGDFSLSPGGARYDANGNLIASVPATPSASSRPSVSIQGDSTTGKYKVTTYPDGTTTVQRLPGPLGKPSASSSRVGGLSASSFNVALRDTKSEILSGAKPTIGPSHFDSTTNTTIPGAVTAPPVPVQQALSNAYAAIPAGVKPKVWAARVNRLVKAAYAPYIPELTQAARAALALGNDDANTTIEKITGTNHYPADLVQRIVGQVYAAGLRNARTKLKTFSLFPKG